MKAGSDRAPNAKKFSNAQKSKNIFFCKKIKKIYLRTRSDLKNTTPKKLGSESLSALRWCTKRKKRLGAKNLKLFFYEKLKKKIWRTPYDVKNTMPKKLWFES